MSNPLEIFLFKGCESEPCKESYNLLLSYSKQLSKLLDKELSGKLKGEVNIIIADSRGIRALNKKFRNVDSETDVLAFPIEEGVQGEVWVCPNVIKRNAAKFNQKYESEFLRVVVHGLLHLAGYDHTKPFVKDGQSKEEMFVLQEKILSEILSEV